MKYILRDSNDKPVRLFSMKGESDEVWEADQQSAIYCIARYLFISEIETISMLLKSDMNNPVIYQDQVFWVEPF